MWLSRGEAESTALREVLERNQAEIVPHKKGKVQKDYIIRMLLTLPLALRPLASIRGADIVSLRDAWLQDDAPETVLRRRVALSHVFSVARKEWGMESLSTRLRPYASLRPIMRVCGVW